MKKKVKKIPKYAEGTVPFYKNTDFYSQIGDFAMQQYDNVQQSKEGVTTGGVAKGAITGGLAGAGVGTMIAPGIGTAIGAGVGALAGGITSAIGSGASYDGKSSSTDFNQIYQKGSGIASWFDDEAGAIRGATMVQNANIAKQQTQMLRAKYSMNPNNPVNPIVNAAEGGTVPGEHYASRGEVEVAADGTNAVRYGWDTKGKDTYHVYTNPDGSSAVGNMVFTEEGVKRPNGEKYSDAAEKIIKGTKEGSKLRQISLRKLANEMEEQKMNKDIKQIKNGIPAHEKGIYYVDGQRAEYRHGRWWWNEGGKKDAQGKMYFVPYTGKSTPSETEPTKYTSETPVGPLDPAYRQHVRYSSTNDVERKATVSKPSSSKKATTTSRVTTSTVPKEEKLTPEQISESLRIADIGERHWLRGSIAEPNQSLASLAQTTPEKLKMQKLAATQSSRTSIGSNNSTNTNTNWGDLAYKAASVLTPLFDREKAEPVQYQVPIAKYRPTSVNIDPQRRAIDESYAMARYNQANISPNTGVGMAYGLQAATNRAKQLSDVYSWQTNAQNNLIGQNVDTYNKWSADYANIMNSVYDKAAANRATARNINRQNRATALKNWGQIRRDDKAYEMDRMKLQMLDPMLQYGYENYDNYLKWKKENGYG